MASSPKKSALGLMVFAILIVSLNLRPAISSVGPMLGIIRNDLSLSNSEISLLTSIPVFCMGLFAPLAIWFNRTLGMKRSVSLLTGMIGLLTLLRGFIPIYSVLLATSFFIGLSIAVISPLLSALIKRNFPTRTASLIGVYSFGMGAGATLASGMTGIFYAMADWPFALASWSILALIAVILWQRIEQPAEKQTDLKRTAVVSPWKNRRAWLMLVFFGFQSAIFFSLITWLAPIALDKGMTVLAAGAVLTVMTAVQLIGNLLIPVVLKKVPSRLFWTLISLASGTIGLTMLLFGAAALIWVAAVFLGVMLGGLFPITLLMPLDENKRADDVNSWTAMIQSGGYIISSLMPFFIGILYDSFGTHDITLLLLLGFIAILAVLAILLDKKQYARRTP